MMKHVPESLRPAVHRCARHCAPSRTTSSMLRATEKARATTTSARTSRRCCSISSGHRPSTCWTSAVGPSAICTPSSRWATAPSAWRARTVRLRWRARIAAARCWYRTSCSSNCHRCAPTVCLPMPCCSICSARCCLRCCDNCRPACGRATCCSVPTRAAMAGRAGTVSATACSMDWPAWRALVTTAGFAELDLLLPSAGAADRATALAGGCLAQAMRPGTTALRM